MSDRFLQDNPELLASNSKYTPKLDFATRCSVLACVKAGVLKQVVAVAFGINPATINHITRPSSLHYKSVRRELLELGLDRFIKQYLTEEVEAKLKEAHLSYKASLSQEAMTEENYDAATTPDKRANRFEGRRSLFWPHGTLYCNVEWLTPPTDEVYQTSRAEGWYVRVERTSPGWDDSLFVEVHGFEADATTSKRAWDAFKSAVEGKEDNE